MRTSENPLLNRRQGRSPLVRDDLDIERVDGPDPDQTSYLVRDPVTGEMFEFGEIEYFILSNLDGVTDSSKIIAALAGEFGTRVTLDQFEDFVGMLARWGLLDRAARKPQSSQPRRSPAPSIPFRGRHNQRATGAPRHDEPPVDDLLRHDEPFEYDHGSETWEADSENGPRRQERPDAMQAAGHWSWFNPDRLFYGIAVLLRPFRLLAYLLPLAFVVAIAAVLNNFDSVVSDLPKVWGPVNLAQHLLFSLITVNLITQVLQGTVARGFGVTGQSFGMRLALGLIPRFDTLIGKISNLPRRTQIWIHLSSLFTGIGLFTVFSLLWLTSRTNGTALHAFAMTISTVALLGTIFRANPLSRGPGYLATAAFLEFPDLKEKAFAALFSRFSHRAALRGRDAEHKFALKSYALACLIFFVALFGFILYVSARYLELHYQGTGVALILALFIYLVWRFRNVRRRRTELRKERASQARAEARAQAKKNGGVLVPGAGFQLDSVQRTPHVPTRRAPRRKTRWLGLVLIAILVPIAFLPYAYETGGPATTLPVRQHEVHAETSGVVAKVYFRGGEWVPEGTAIGELDSYEQRKNVSVTLAAIQEQQSELDRLLNTPTKEELEVVQKKLQTARTQAKYSADNASRYEKLFSKGHVSEDDYLDAMRRKEVDEAEVIEAKANFDLVKSGAHPNDIEAARSELEGLRQQLLFYQEQLKRTKLVMPADGRLVTPDLHLKKGKYLNKGNLFAVAEDDSTIRVEILVPESDIADVKIGSSTRLKIWTYPGRAFEGKVTEIAPVVTNETQGKFVRVISDIPNPNGLIKSGMSGFGKIDGGTKPVYVAFTRMFVRFALIEVWSWLP